MGRFIAWAGANLDGFIALLLAMIVAGLGLSNTVEPEVVNSATLLILALLAEAVLRDRWRRGPIEQDTRVALTGLPQRLDKISELEKAVQETRGMLDDMSMVRVLRGAEVREALKAARHHTDRWMFKGGTGTYTRAVTLPECVANSRRYARQLSVRLEILDPSNEELCEQYAQFRHTLADAPDPTGELWTVDRTRKEAYATVLAACLYRRRYRLLDIEVRLSSAMTTFRWDLSSDSVVITQEDFNAPAMVVPRGTFFYDRWYTELQTSADQAYRVPIERVADLQWADEPSIEDARRIFARLDLELPSTFEDRAVGEIVQKAINARNPYER